MASDFQDASMASFDGSIRLVRGALRTLRHFRDTPFSSNSSRWSWITFYSDGRWRPVMHCSSGTGSPRYDSLEVPLLTTEYWSGSNAANYKVDHPQLCRGDPQLPTRLIIASISCYTHDLEPLVANRAFPVVDPWNDLPADVTSAESLTRCVHFASGWKPISSQNHFPAISWTLINLPGHWSLQWT